MRRLLTSLKTAIADLLEVVGANLLVEVCDESQREVVQVPRVEGDVLTPPDFYDSALRTA